MLFCLHWSCHTIIKTNNTRSHTPQEHARVQGTVFKYAQDLGSPCTCTAHTRMLTNDRQSFVLIIVPIISSAKSRTHRAASIAVSFSTERRARCKKQLRRAHWIVLMRPRFGCTDNIGVISTSEVQDETEKRTDTVLVNVSQMSHVCILRIEDIIRMIIYLASIYLFLEFEFYHFNFLSTIILIIESPVLKPIHGLVVKHMLLAYM
jgi:hypothetical protein